MSETQSKDSKDGGVEDAAEAGASASTVETATRLSWFLAEVDEGALDSGELSGLSRLYVLHSMELVEGKASDKYLTRIVDFRVEGRMVEAKLILAADCRNLIDTALTRADNQISEDAVGQTVLVQYTDNNELIQKLTDPINLMWLSAKPELGGTPIVKVGEEAIGHLLYSHENHNHMEKALLHLKARCFDFAFDLVSKQPAYELTEASWMLVQYSPDPRTVKYRIIQYSETIWRKENHFPDVIAYMQLPGSEIILQAVVISFGPDRKEQQTMMDKMTVFVNDLNFPDPTDLAILLKQGTAALFGRTTTTLFQRGEVRDCTREHRDMRKELEQMGVKAHNEAKLIIEAFDMVDNINKSIQTRLTLDTTCKDEKVAVTKPDQS